MPRVNAEAFSAARTAARPPARTGLRWLTGVAVAALLLSSCAKGVSDTPEPSDSEYGPNAQISGQLQVMGFGAGDEIATTRLDLAKKAVSPATVKLVEGDLDVQQFLSAVASGKPPAIVYANRDQIGTFASRGAIISLDKCIAGEAIAMADFNEAAVAQVTFNGKVYGIPEFNQVQVTQANGDLLKKAGLTIDDVNGSDWDKLAMANEKLAKTEKGKIKTIGYDPKMPEFLPLWAKANGVDMISADGKTAQLNDPKVVQSLEFAVSLYQAQGGFGKVKAYRDSADFFGAKNQFATDALGAMPMEQWYINVLNDVSPDAPMAFDTYRTPQSEPLAFASGSAWAIPKGSASAAGACRLAKTMTMVDSWMAAAKVRADKRAAEKKPFTGVLTGNKTADAQIKTLVKPSGDSKWDSGVAAAYEANEHTFALPANPADAEFKSAWQDAVNRVLNGQQQPQAAMDQAQKEAQAALDKAWANLKDE
jgi:multiple sugar transport system substrate-binding protein